MQIARRMSDIRPFHVMEILARAQALEREGRDVVHMEIGEPDFPTPPWVVEAALAAIRDGEVKYTPAAGLPELREAIAAYYGRRYGVRVEPRRVFVTPGASGGFLLALGLWVEPGAGVALADPGYPCYANFVRLFEGVPHLVPVDAADRFHLSRERVARHWGGGMRGAVVASPANPTGTLIEPGVLRELIGFVQERGGFVVSDEIYHGLEYGAPSPTALEFSDEVFVVNSFSKYFGMTGWRVGWVVVPEGFVAAAERLAQNIFISTATPSQIAALAAFAEENIRELEGRRGLFRERRDFLWAGLRELGFGIPARPEGAFYIYADCGPFSRDSQDFARSLLAETGVALTPGLDFGKHRPEGFIRLCYTAPLARLAEGLARIGGFVRGGPGG
ncbi:aminotransferase class I/II-fold pyridoxal phosphate-dependent enzyme [Methylomagnum ishizawai]|uniref:aminotransferase class I/II-fold pyridoxal phosphate-dependent enzyme n=1 Tax=Methylomagnum ishizawai TaxID=1760988 RepID=UPI001C338EE4|nr:aminotransferase class I/II-fold pyridoxal phosphate-dependent enzyme [Methylomagnum ishizawai]BBL74294.1 aminotransferase [Methylomagnum ishizawai]